MPVRRSWRLPAGLGLIAGFATLSLLSGLDRIGARDTTAAHRVPEPWRIASARAIAVAEIEASRPRRALPAAERAVRADPVDPQSVALLAASRYALGDFAGARDAYSVSGLMGWREPLTQLYWMSVALDLGDYRVASLRLDAVLRQAVNFPQRTALLARLEAMPRGRIELARRLADAPAWRLAYFSEVSGLGRETLAARAVVAENLTRLGGVRDCALVAPLTRSLAALGDYGNAHAVWRAHCASPGAPAGVADGGFEATNLAGQPSAFDWSWSDSGALDLLIAPVAGFAGRALTVSSNAPVTTVFASQTLILPTGAHVLSWRALDQSGNPATAVRVSFACDAAARNLLTPRLADRRTGRFEAPIEVSAGCPTQWLRMAIAPGTQPVTIDEVAVARP